MKISALYSLFFLAALTILFWNASGGAAAVQEADRTRSPLSDNSSCATCHNAGNYSPGMDVQLRDGELPVTVYEPGKTYTLRVAVTGAPTALGFGFQAVALSGDDHVNAGTFGTAPAGMQVISLNDRMYAEHSMRSDTNIFVIDWTAPDSGAGNVRFYASGNAANANNSVTGDQGTFLVDPLVLTEFGASATSDRLLTFEAINIAPNPTHNSAWISLQNKLPGTYTMTLFNAVGQSLQQQSLQLAPGQQTHRLDLSDQPQGVYFLQISNGRQLLTRKILKQ